MRAEYFPFARAQALENGLPLNCAELGVAVHTGQQNGGIAVVLALLGGHAGDGDVDIAGYRDMAAVVDQHDLAILEHDVAGMEILMDERVPVRDLVDDLVKLIGFLLCVKTSIERRLDIGSGSVSRIRERTGLKFRAVELL